MLAVAVAEARRAGPIIAGAGRPRYASPNIPEPRRGDRSVHSQANASVAPLGLYCFITPPTGPFRNPATIAPALRA